MKTRSKYLLAKIEGTYGTDPTPVAANAIITSGLSRELYAGPTVMRENDRATLGARQQINTAPGVTQQFSVEMMGSGALGTPPNMGVLLRACGFAETITASTRVEYEPVSAAYESITTYYDRGAERQISRGMRGNAGLSFVAGTIPKFNFQLKGFYTKPANQTMVVPAPVPNRSPYPVNKVNTTDVTLGAYDMQLQSLEMDFGLAPNHLNLAGYEEVILGDREMTGTLVVLAPHISTKDMFDLVESHTGVTTDAFQLIHGPALDIVQLDAPAMQLSTITEVDIAGELGYSMTFRLITVSGDDEFMVTFK